MSQQDACKQKKTSPHKGIDRPKQIAYKVQNKKQNNTSNIFFYYKSDFLWIFSVHADKFISNSDIRLVG